MDTVVTENLLEFYPTESRGTWLLVEAQLVRKEASSMASS